MMIDQASTELAKSYCHAVDTVARERKYLGCTIGFSLESTIEMVKSIVDKNLSQYYAIENGEVIGWRDILLKSHEGLTHVGVLGMGILSKYRGKGLGTQHVFIGQRWTKVDLTRTCLECAPKLPRNLYLLFFF
jgi:hypothetical protein